MIEVDGLCKSFGKRSILSQLGFSLDAGSVMVLTGPTGSGRTTLLRILATLEKPSSGRCLVNGIDLIRKAGELRSLIGYLPEDPVFRDPLTIREFLDFECAMRPGVRPGVVRDLLSGLQTIDCETEVGTLSAGERQLVALAIVLLREPEILLLDEPLRCLDQESAEEVCSVLSTARNKGATVILACNNSKNLIGFADYIGHLRKGSLKVQECQATSGWAQRGGK